MQKRWDKGEKHLAEFTTLARIGSSISSRLMSIINQRKVIDESNIHATAPEGALLLAATRPEVERINNEAYKYLCNNLQRDHITIWAYHTRGKKGEFDYEARLNALKKRPVEGSDHSYKWLGSFRNVMSLAIGSRVRYLMNKCPMASLYQGSLGTVVGFGLPPGRTIDDYRMKRNGKWCDMDIETAARRNLEVPLVYVQMDKKDGFTSAWADTPGVICFKAEQTKNGVNGHPRFMLPLLPAHARTFHAAQGITAFNGVVLFKPARKVFALMYVGISRIKTLSKLFLMKSLSQEDFQSGGTTFSDIEREMERLRGLRCRIV